MGMIHRLSDETIRQIAAGEVIERPASVIKELVENSIDAAANFIRISVEEAPSYNIKVSDDGEGMTKKDLAVCLERHTTSKLKEIDDLNDVDSYGFRGEALSSIAGISKVSIQTQAVDSETGWEFNGGLLKSHAFPPGTTVEVNDLFYNTPARKKFLKAPQTERAVVVQTVEELALAVPDIAFELNYNGKTLFSYAASTLENRIKTVFKKRWLSEESRFFTIEDSVKGAHLWVLCSEPSMVSPSSKNLNFFVNQRAIRDRVLAHAVRAAFGTISERGSWPYLVMFLNLPGELVDVNVHPTKREVRFSDSQFIHRWIFSVLQKGIQKHQAKRFAPVASDIPRREERIDSSRPTPGNDSVKKMFSLSQTGGEKQLELPCST